jgi:iron complex outermembrane receptor protein
MSLSPALSSARRAAGALPGRPRPLALALQLLLAGALLAPALPGRLEAAEAVRSSYAIAGGPLGEVLTRFAAQAGARLSFDPALVDGLRSGGLQGSYGVEEGFRRILTGSGLGLNEVSPGEFSLRRLPPPTRGETTLGTVQVSAAAEGSGYVAVDARSATKSDTPLLETARSISVVTEEQMRDRKVQSVEEAVAYTAGVQVAAWGDDPRFDQITVRGFEVTTDADYRDGLRQPYTGWLSVFRSEPYALERLEIVKGPNSVLFGQISPGGLVNRVSKRPTRQTLREVEVQTGNNDHAQAQFDLGGALSPESDWSYRLTGILRRSNTGTKGVNDDVNYLAPALTWSPSARTQVTFLSHWQEYETSASPRPLQLPSGELSRFWAGDEAFDGLKQRQSTIGYEARHQVDDTFTLRQNLRYGGITTSNQYLDASLNADGHTVDRTTTGVYEHMNSLAVDTALESRFRTGALSHALTLGVDYNRFGGNIRYLSGSAPSIDMWSPNYNQTIASPDTLLSNQDVEGRQTGVYANDQVNWDNWRLSLGLRRDSVSQTQRELSTNASSSQKDSATSGSVGLLYLINDTWAPYVSYATSFNPQFGVNLAGEAFKPTEGKMWEAGLKYQPVDGNAMVTLSVFDLVQQNVKTRDPNNVLNQVQTGEVSSRGVELESVLNLKGGLNLVGSYTWQDLEVSRSNDGNQGKVPVGKPEQMAALWAKYKIEGGTLAGLDLGLGARRIGRTYADGANSRENAGYTLVDARIGYELKQLAPGVTLAINATNLTDKEYLMCHDGYCYRGRGRSVIGSLNYRW